MSDRDPGFTHPAGQYTHLGDSILREEPAACRNGETIATRRDRLGEVALALE